MADEFSATLCQWTRLSYECDQKRLLMEEATKAYNEACQDVLNAKKVISRMVGGWARVFYVTPHGVVEIDGSNVSIVDRVKHVDSAGEQVDYKLLVDGRRPTGVLATPPDRKIMVE